MCNIQLGMATEDAKSLAQGGDLPRDAGKVEGGEADIQGLSVDYSAKDPGFKVQEGIGR